MKKIFISLFMGLFIFVFTGCSQNTKMSDSYSEVAVNYLKGLAEQNYEMMDKYSVVEYEKIHKPIIESAMREYSKTEAEIYEMLLEGEEITTMPTNYEEYKEVYVENFKKRLKEEYGENYSVDATVISTTDIYSEDIGELLKEASDYYDSYDIVISDIVNFSDIEEIKKMQCKVYFSGTEESTEDFSIYVAKINNKWKVLNLGVA